MRMKVSRLTTKYLRNKVVTKDNEGATLVSWATAIPFECEYWVNTSYLEPQVQGQELGGEFYMHLDGEYSVSSVGNHQVYTFDTFSLCEGDGVNLFNDSTDKPDFIIQGITAYKPLMISLVRNNG